ncbi:MAG: hypothetical protein EB060_04725 [Proteobacteria bacterium]|nr:hypothetical protein [Pseudomonadota bacterium]
MDLAHAGNGHRKGTYVIVASREKQYELAWRVEWPRLIFEPTEHLTKLSEQDRLQLFNGILASYRKSFEVEEAFKVSAIALTDDGDYFIAHNLRAEYDSPVNPFRRACAEDNLIRAIHHTKGEKVKIETLYMMGGRTEANGDAPPCLPCGMCTDALCKASRRDAQVVTFPASDGTVPIKLNLDAHSLSDVKAGETWQTHMPHLNIDYELTLSAAGRDVSKRALQSVESGKLKLTKANGLEEDASVTDINAFMVKKLVSAYRARKPTGSGLHNVEKVRCAVVRTADGALHYGMDMIGPDERSMPFAEQTAAVRSDELMKPITEMWVMEFDPYDIARGVLHTSPKWALETVYKRKMKESEAQPVVDSIKIHYIPFNSGKIQEQRLNELMRNYDMEDIFTSQYKGNKGYRGYGGNGGGDGRVH